MFDKKQIQGRNEWPNLDIDDIENIKEQEFEKLIKRNLIKAEKIQYHINEKIKELICSEDEAQKIAPKSIKNLTKNAGEVTSNHFINL